MAAVAAAAAVFGFQLVVVAGVSASHVRLRDQHRYPAAFRAAAARIPPRARFTATSFFGMTGMRFAAYPREPVAVGFQRAPAEVRARLRARNVRFVVVTPPNVPRLVRGAHAWYRIVWRSRSPALRLLEVAR